MVNAHETLLTLLDRKRDALRRNDADALAQVGVLEKEKITRIATLEKQRAELAARITLQLDPQATRPLRLGELADHLPEPARGRLLVQRQQLRQRMEAVREAASIARRASETLFQHMQGLVRSVVTMANGVTTYTPTAASPHAQPAVRTINLTA